MPVASFPYENELRMLVKFSAFINSSLEIQEVLDNALFCVEQLVGAEVSSIFEVEREKGELLFRVCRGPGAKALKEMRLKMGEGAAGWVALTEKPLLIPDISQDSRFCPRFDRQSGFKTKSLLCVPIKASDELIGVLEVVNKQEGKTFTEVDQDLLILLGNMIGVAMENAYLYSRVREKLALTEEELKVVEQKLIQAERLAALGKLSQGVAHEVRNPIMVIGGFAHRLRKHLSPEDPAQGVIGTIIQEVSRLEQMVREIEAFANLPEPKPKLQSLAEVLNRVLADNAASLQEQNILLMRVFPPGIPSIPLDANLIRLALQLLIDNAREAMPQGGSLTVELGLEAKGIQMTLSDTGSGIPPENMPYLFDPFFSSRPDGTGMGLTTVYRIVSDHHGEIKIDSQLQKGTTVHIWLPRWRGK